MLCLGKADTLDFGALLSHGFGVGLFLAWHENNYKSLLA